MDRPDRSGLALGLLAVAWPCAALADDSPPDRSGEIVVYGRSIAQVGTADSGSQGSVGYADFEQRPLSRVGELAENVPGLIATQHSGEGKANQYFLRGFNLDHGTDLAGFVDGAPVNMRSHGNGQGYLDLNFLIPELVERIDYTKGPYHADQGDFASAGSLSFITKSRLPAPIAQVTGGSFGYARGLLAGSARLGELTLLAGIDVTRNDGPWVLDERQRKLSALVKASGGNWSLALAGYTNRWNSTDQIPQRAVLSGLIPLNGNIDPDLGGRSGRLALTFNGAFADTRISAYAIASRLELTSNFTYFLDDPVHGDQFRQVDRRGVFGGSLRHTLHAGGIDWRFGADLRWDRIGKLGLYRTEHGAITATVREDRVDEVGGAVFAEGEWHLTPRLRLIAGLRGDAIGYDVRSDLAANSGTGSAAIVTPKAALAWHAADGLELYANYGEGYHSNDVRGATIRVDSASGDPAGQVPVFARSRGAELGARLERHNLTASLVGFWLDVASELVFVGDAGATEPNAASRRFGTELALFWKPAPWLTLDGGLALTHTRFRGVAPDQTFVSGATPAVLSAGAAAKWGQWSGSLRVRHFASAPLIEDNSVRSRATTLVNLGAYRQLGRWQVAVDVLNLLGSRDPDISYFYTSRLAGEPAAGVDDVHIHPVEPRQVRVTVKLAI